MPFRSLSQKLGAKGHRWLMLEIERNPAWLVRELGEDYGIDMEAELTEYQVKGEILKIQVKSHAQIERREGAVRFSIDRRYLEYADACRYPVVMVAVDVASEQGWYLWLQDWLMQRRAVERGFFSADQWSWTEWVSEDKTIASGLNDELKAVARWKGETQRALSLVDAIRATTSLGEIETTRTLARLLLDAAPAAADATLDSVISDLATLADGAWNTGEGHVLQTQLFALVKELGNRVSAATVSNMVKRGDSYSRVGLTALGLLYDESFEYARSLGLPELFTPVEPRVAYYCAYREIRPNEKSSAPMDPAGFEFAGLRYEASDDRTLDRWANHGPSAFLDDLRH